MGGVPNDGGRVLRDVGPRCWGRGRVWFSASRRPRRREEQETRFTVRVWLVNSLRQPVRLVKCIRGRGCRGHTRGRGDAAAHTKGRGALREAQPPGQPLMTAKGSSPPAAWGSRKPQPGRSHPKTRDSGQNRGARLQPRATVQVPTCDRGLSSRKITSLTCSCPGSPPDVRIVLVSPQAEGALRPLLPAGVCLCTLDGAWVRPRVHS